MPETITALVGSNTVLVSLVLLHIYVPITTTPIHQVCNNIKRFATGQPTSAFVVKRTRPSCEKFHQVDTNIINEAVVIATSSEKIHVSWYVDVM